METLKEAYKLTKRSNGAPGIDGVTFESIEAKGLEEYLQQIRHELITKTYSPNRNRRKEIPKAGGKLRALNIPTITDRAKQTLVKMVIEPEWEAKFEPNTYGFRSGRSCHDAIAAIFTALGGKKTAFILDADIAGCFDNINHNKLLDKLNTTPTLRRIIKGWLEAGVMEYGKFQSTKSGTIQGGTISPLLACVALHGLEQHIKEGLTSELFQYSKKKCGRATYKDTQRSISIITYADDCAP